MDNGLDLTLRLALSSPTVETHLSLLTPITDQGINVVHGGRRDNDDDKESARNNVDVNIRVYTHIFNHYAGIGQTLNFTPYPAPAPAPEIPDPVLIDVPARRARRNNFLATENANLKRRRGCGGCGGGRIDGTKECTNLNCKAIMTPMWRKGPLGPKTLCNACGIKFRKEEERRSKRDK